MATLVWLCRDAFVARLDELISEEAEDDAALDDQTRAKRLNEIATDLVATEYSEGGLTWLAIEAGINVEFSEGLPAQAVLGLALQTRK